MPTRQLFLPAFVFISTFALTLGACTQTAPPPEESQPVEDTPEAPSPEEPETTGVPIIFDTDLGYDCDDAGALGVLHALADLGETTPLATITVVGTPHSAGALDVINTYYNHPDLPVGAYPGERWSDAKPYWLEPDTGFLEPLVAEYRSDIETNDQAEEAVTLYRKTLAAQPDASVTIVVVGFLQNLADLLDSGSDAHSPLSGEALAAKKVKQVVVMGGSYPDDGKWHDFNLRGGPEDDGQAAQKVVETWPTPIVFVGNEITGDVYTGSGLKDTLPENPVAHIYDLYPGTNNRGERQSWDLAAVLYAVRGTGDLWSLRKDSHIVVNDNGSHRWEEGAVKPARISLQREVSAKEVAAVLDELLMQPPKDTAEPPASRTARAE